MNHVTETADRILARAKELREAGQGQKLVNVLPGGPANEGSRRRRSSAAPAPSAQAANRGARRCGWVAGRRGGWRPIIDPILEGATRR